MKQFCMKINLISQGRENVLLVPSNMAATTSHENALYKQINIDTETQRDRKIYIYR